MPKGKKKGRKTKKVKVEPDFCDEQNFDEDLSVLYIEYSLECPIFKERAQALFEKLCVQFPEKKIKLVENQPRKGSFEVRIARNCRLPSENLWTGIEKEPRELKFPNSDEDFSSIFTSVKRVLDQ